MTTVTPTTRTPATGEDALSDVRAVLDQPEELYASWREIEDASALAIASWWQSAGYKFDALANGEPFDVEELLEEIAIARRQHGRDMHRDDRSALDCLATWALRHSSRA